MLRPGSHAVVCTSLFVGRTNSSAGHSRCDARPSHPSVLIQAKNVATTEAKALFGRPRFDEGKPCKHGNFLRWRSPPHCSLAA